MNKPLGAIEKLVLLVFFEKRNYALGGLAGFNKTCQTA